MPLSTFKYNYLTPLHFKGLIAVNSRCVLSFSSFYHATYCMHTWYRLCCFCLSVTCTKTAEQIELVFATLYYKGVWVPAKSKDYFFMTLWTLPQLQLFHCSGGVFWTECDILLIVDTDSSASFTALHRHWCRRQSLTLTILINFLIQLYTSNLRIIS